MKSENRFSKKIQDKVFSEMNPQEIKQIDQMLADLEIVWKKWVKAHPDWKSHE